MALQTLRFGPSTWLSVFSGGNNIIKIQARPYRDATDLTHMRQLLVIGHQANIPASYTHPGALDWGTHYPPDEQENRRDIQLWERLDEDPPTLEAWAIFLRRENTFDLFVSPTLHGTLAHEAVMDEYVTGPRRVRVRPG